MTAGITHTSVAVTADDGSGLEGPNEWNAAHTVSVGGIPTNAVANLSGTNTGDQTLSDATISTTDITTNNVSTSKHGFAPKAPNDATKFLDGTGAYSTPVSSGVSISRLGKTAVGATTKNINGHGPAKKITLASSGLIVSIMVNMTMASDSNINLGGSLWTDSSGPSKLLCSASGGKGNQPAGPDSWLETSGGSGFAARWMSFPIGYYAAAGSYWISISGSNAGTPTIAMDTGGTDYDIAFSGFGLGDANRLVTPSSTTDDYSMYAVVLS